MAIDTINDLPPRVQYTASASQTVFPYPFPIFQDADLTVEVDGVVQTLTTHYTVSGEGEDLGGNVTFVTGLSAGQIVTIYRQTVMERDSDFQLNGPMFSTSVNNEFDKLTIISQELRAAIRRCLRIPFSAEVDDSDIELTSAASWAGKYITLDENLQPQPALLLGTELTQPSFDTFLGDSLPYDRTEAETDQMVFPTTLTNPGDIRRYGAVGDGVTDCTAAFEAAIAQANHETGSEVFIPQGTWVVSSPLTGVRGLKMTGEGRYRSIVQISGAINFMTFSGTVGNPDGGAMVFRDFTVKGSSTSGSHFDFNYGGQTEFQGMRFWLCGAASGAFVVLNTECHRTSFRNCLFQTWANAAVLTAGIVNSILTFQDCQFNANGTSGIVAGSGSAGISLGSGEQVFINSCNVNGDDALNHFVRFTGNGAGNARIAECYVEHITQSAIICDSNTVFNGLRVENCNLSCDNSVSIDLSSGNQAHRGIVIKNIRRPESGAVFILSTGTGIVDFNYSGSLLDGSAGHVVGYTGQTHVRRFVDGTVRLGASNRHVVGPFTQDNVAGTVGATALTGNRFIALRAGRVTGIVVKSTEARTAGTLTVNVFKNTGLSGAAGSVLADSPSADLNASNTGFAVGLTQDQDSSFVAGDELYATYQTSSFTPTTADIRVWLEIEM